MKREILFDEVLDGQKYYRLLLDSMARPGKVNIIPEMDVLPPTGLNKASVIVAMTLLNADVSFYVDNINAKQISSYLLLNTSSSPVDVEKANFIFLNGRNEGYVLADAQVGTLSYPEEGATCIVDVASISNTFIVNAIKIQMSGPGVKDQCDVYVSGLSKGILENLSAQNREFPLGIDMIITDVNNNVFCIPRSNRLSWKSQD